MAGEFDDDGEPGNPIHRQTAARIMEDARRLGVADLLADRIQAATEGGAASDLTSLVEQFITTHERRYQVSDLSTGRFDQLRRDARHFLAWANPRTTAPADINAGTIEDYHNAIMQDVASGLISRAYARTRWVTLRMLIEWGWEREAWALPRNLKARRFAINVPNKTVKTYPLADLREVLDAAADKTRLYLLLMLNCGMYQSDISDLHPSEVKLGSTPTITRKRSKTADNADTPTVRYPLWPEVARLLKEYRSTAPERYPVNDNGDPLRTDIFDANGNLRRRDAIRSAVRRVYLKVRPRVWWAYRQSVPRAQPAIDEARLRATAQAM